MKNNCDKCKKAGKTQECFFRENVSYIFRREEKIFIGNLCFRCLNSVFGKLTIRTLFGTWWGIIGFFVGPFYIVRNVMEYIKAAFKFLRDKG
jgi:hypothetical protein